MEIKFNIKLIKVALMINFNDIKNHNNFFSNFKVSARNNENKNSVNSSDEVLGYKVDKEGFFTSEFNEKAGIPSDYKIHSSTMQSLVKSQTSGGVFNSFSREFKKLR